MRVKRRVRSKISCCERAQMSAVASVRRLACVTWNGSSAAGRIDTRKPNKKLFRQFGVFTNVFLAIYKSSRIWKHGKRKSRVNVTGNHVSARRLFASKGKISYHYMFSRKKYLLSRFFYSLRVAFFYYFCKLICWFLKYQVLPTDI